MGERRSGLGRALPLLAIPLLAGISRRLVRRSRDRRADADLWAAAIGAAGRVSQGGTENASAAPTGT
jgi:hypothetical protein